MVTGVSAGGQFQEPNPTDYNTIKSWLEALEQWSNQFPDAASHTPLFAEIRKELDEYLNGSKGYKSLTQILNDLRDNFFSGAGNLDIYANSGLDSAEPIEAMMKIFGLTPPPVTPMDQLLFEFQHAILTGTLPSGGDNLLKSLHDEMLALGSKGDVNQLRQWGQNELGSADFKNASPEAQLFFKKILGL